MKKTFIALFLALCLQGAAGADTFDLNTIADGVTFSTLPDYQYGGVSPLGTGNFSGMDTRSYLKFDLTSLSNITSAYLWVNKYYSYAPIGYDSGVTAYATSSAWEENGINYGNQPSLGTADGTTIVSPGLMGWYSWDVSAIAAASEGGIFSVALSSTGYYHQYYSRENGQWVGYIPYLSVTTAVPEPVSTALFILGGATLMARRLRRKTN